MRVLFVTPFYAESWLMGGMAIAPAEWANTLTNCGVEVDVFATSANGPADLKVPLGIPTRRDGVRVTYFPRIRKSGNLFISLPLYSACKKSIPTYDAVHSIGLWTFPSIVSSIIAKKFSIPYIISLHGMLMPWAYTRHKTRKKIFMELIERKRIRNASSIICSSPLELNYFEKSNSGNSVVIPNVIPSPRIEVKEARKLFRQQYNLQNSIVLIFAGRLVRNKGIHLTIAAIKKIISKHPTTRLIIVGPFEDGSGDLAKEQVRKLRLDEHVLFLGPMHGNSYWSALAGADLFVLNSYSENFGMAPAEALSVGVPVLLSDQVGISELVLQYKAGKVTSLDINAISEAMNCMISDIEQLQKMGRNGIQLTQNHLSSVAIGQQFVTMLESIVQKTRN